MPRKKTITDLRTDHHFRANAAEVRDLDALAARLGVGRSAAIRWAVKNAVLPGDAGEERSCFTCAYASGPACLNPEASVDDGSYMFNAISDYANESGAAVAINCMPINRTIRCPGWKAKEQA